MDFCNGQLLGGMIVFDSWTSNVNARVVYRQVSQSGTITARRVYSLAPWVTWGAILRSLTCGLVCCGPCALVNHSCGLLCGCNLGATEGAGPCRLGLQLVHETSDRKGHG